MGYNGWNNWATWNATNYFDSDLRDQVLLDIFKEYTDQGEDKVREEYRSHFEELVRETIFDAIRNSKPGNEPEIVELAGDFDNIDWDEIFLHDAYDSDAMTVIIRDSQGDSRMDAYIFFSQDLEAAVYDMLNDLRSENLMDFPEDFDIDDEVDKLLANASSLEFTGEVKDTEGNVLCIVEAEPFFKKDRIRPDEACGDKKDNGPDGPR